jgi:ABC-2 type transport system permease protein
MIDTGTPVDLAEATTMLTIGFALTFQIYGTALSFENLSNDFFTPKHDRLLASPVSPQKIVASILFTSILVSFLQTLVIVFFSIVILKTKFESLFLVLLVLLISVMVNQLIGTTLLFITKKTRTTSAITIFYGIIAPIISGLYFPLPEGKILDLMKSYLTPMSLAQTAIQGIIHSDYKAILLGATPLVIIVVALFMLINPLSKRVMV